MSAKMVSLFNHKGDVSKTTTPFNLGWMLATQGKRVPAEVCTTCGERYYDQRTSRQLLEAAELAANSGVQVDVREFLAA